jgi:hypothetical protein
MQWVRISKMTSLTIGSTASNIIHRENSGAMLRPPPPSLDISFHSLQPAHKKMRRHKKALRWRDQIKRQQPSFKKTKKANSKVRPSRLGSPF